MSLTEEGADVLHDWIDKCETKARAHAKRSSYYQTLSISTRTILVLSMAVVSLVSIARSVLYSSQTELAYGIVFAMFFILLMFFYGTGSIDRSTFHLRMMHELTFAKAKCSMMLSERKSPEIIKDEYNSLMTRSNKLMNMGAT